MVLLLLALVSVILNQSLISLDFRIRESLCLKQALSEPRPLATPSQDIDGCREQ
jgi:hypothetical protein